MRWGFAICAALVACANDRENTSASRPAPAPATSVQPTPPSLPSSRIALLPNPAASLASAKFWISTDPDGASVSEDGHEVCSSPCEILYSGPDADPAKVHTLVIREAGCSVATKRVKVSDSPFTARLTCTPARPRHHTTLGGDGSMQFIPNAFPSQPY